MSDDLASRLTQLSRQAQARISGLQNSDEIESARVQLFGRRSELKGIQQDVANLEGDSRREVGRLINEVTQRLKQELQNRKREIDSREIRERVDRERQDLTLPPRRLAPGRPHLLTQVQDEIVDQFVGLGYSVAEGPEAESGIFNFDLLNTPQDHPARQEQDTIYVSSSEDVVLRTQTSAVQARTMLAQDPPLAVVCPGRVYRADSVDATHSPVFTQVEGLLLAEDATMGDLRGTLLAFSRAFFGPTRRIRLRPSFFPFTEPSAEADVACGFCSSANGDCRVCSGTGWIEVLGAGMVDPNVLIACGHDPDAVSGFAFGIGVERVAMLRHGVRDIRDFYDADARFLQQF